MSHHPVESTNLTHNPDIGELLQQRANRRAVLKGAAVVTAGGASATLLAACDGNGSRGGAVARSLSFDAVPRSLEDRVSLPAGYSAQVLYAMGDPIAAGVAAFSNDGTQGDFDRRAGDEHDGMYYFGLGDDGRFDPERSDRGLLCLNHENLEESRNALHGRTTTADDAERPRFEVDNEMNAHGVSVVEVRREAGQWRVVQDSPFNRRITAFTEMRLTGPVAGSELVRTAFDPQGLRSRGTLNNCANGFTPWGTYLTCEENWFSYFRRDDDAALRGEAENTALARYGIGPDSTGFSYRGWDKVAGGGDAYTRFNITQTADGNGFANEPNTFGYIVEINPFAPEATPKKRTALGRFVHEGCWPAPAVAGEPLTFYMGDDNRNDYIYKFVSDAVWNPADAGNPDAGDKYLDAGTLYVAVFNADGSGEWRPLVQGQNGLTADNSLFPFDSQQTVLVHARLAADALGATKMDRPEWGAVNPLNGEVYMTLTNNRERNRPFEEISASNPRFYTDEQGERAGNPNGHIIRWRENGGRNAATAFQWDIFLFGSEAEFDPANVNISGLDASNEFSAPDGLWFDPRGVLWIQTDDGAITDKTNNQMLACIPGSVSDGDVVAITSTSGDAARTLDVPVGVPAVDVQLKRFLTGPLGCEITGIHMTPDNRTMFVNIQHPGEDGAGNWPNPSRDATQAGQAGILPLSATIVITRDDGGEIAV